MGVNKHCHGYYVVLVARSLLYQTLRTSPTENVMKNKFGVQQFCLDTTLQLYRSSTADQAGTCPFKFPMSYFALPRERCLRFRKTVT